MSIAKIFIGPLVSFSGPLPEGIWIIPLLLIPFGIYLFFLRRRGDMEFGPEDRQRARFAGILTILMGIVLTAVFYTAH
ncbi:MAG TPA: hypothetical protein VFN35_32990 [Ktedonobacteraceae bacterium]|nr:hypothetical protein [Ktedonobacteraceae bacterium]